MPKTVIPDLFAKRTRERMYRFDKAAHICPAVLACALAFCARSALAQTAPTAAPPLQVQMPASTAANEGTGSSAAGSDSELAKKLQNPVGDLISVPFQNNLNFNAGPHKGTQNIVETMSVNRTAHCSARVTPTPGQEPSRHPDRSSPSPVG